MSVLHNCYKCGKSHNIYHISNEIYELYFGEVKPPRLNRLCGDCFTINKPFSVDCYGEVFIDFYCFNSWDEIKCFIKHNKNFNENKSYVIDQLKKHISSLIKTKILYLDDIEQYNDIISFISGDTKRVALNLLEIYGTKSDIPNYFTKTINNPIFDWWE